METGRGAQRQWNIADDNPMPSSPLSPTATPSSLPACHKKQVEHSAQPVAPASRRGLMLMSPSSAENS